MISGRFVTFCYLRVDGPGRMMSYSVAGHNPPILMRRTGEIVRLTTGGTVLGVFTETAFEEETVALLPGDRLVLFTDGITEARNAAGDEYDDEGLIASLKRHRHLGAAELQRKLFDDAVAFASEGFQDDATLIVLSVED